MKISRPQTFAEFQGTANQQVVERLKIAVTAAKKLHKPLNHVLLTGNAGTGKTSLAHIIANEMDMNLKVITAGTVRAQKDLMVILWDIWQAQKQGLNTILFIDEIHNLSKSDIPEEIYYSLLEDFVFHHSLMGSEIKVGDKILTPMDDKAWLNPFCIIGATTAAGHLSKPLRDRFAISCFLKEYSKEDIRDVIKRYADAEHIRYEEDALLEIALRSRGNPRIAINFFRSAFDLTISRDEAIVTKEVVLREMQMQHIDQDGLTEPDMRILTTLAENPKGLGLLNLAGTCGIEKSTIETHESFLKVKGLLKVTHKRFLTDRGLELLRQKQLVVA